MTNGLISICFFANKPDFATITPVTHTMARGNQRDLARAKNAKKNAGKAKGRDDDGMTPEQRRERCAMMVQGEIRIAHCIDMFHKAVPLSVNTSACCLHINRNL
jgi:hypothetical protein